MATYSPVITTSSSPGIEITSSNITYEEILNSFGAYYFKVFTFYLQALSVSQIQLPFLFNSFDSTGERYIRVMNPEIDPYQKQPTVFQDARQNAILFDGRTTMNFTILPAEVVVIKIYAERDYIGDYLALKNKTLV